MSTFGHSTSNPTGGSSSVAANTNMGSIYTANGDGTITAYNVYMDGSSGGSSVILCLYNYNGTQAASLVAKSAAVSVSGGVGWKTLAWSAGTGTPAITNGTVYALQLFVVSVGGTPTLWYDTAGAAHRIVKAPDTGGPSDPLNVAPDLARDVAIYATYTPASGFVPKIAGYVVT